MTILNDRVGLDTNVFLLGLRKRDPHSEKLLTYLDRLRLVIPERILRELSVNLTAAEMKEFYAREITGLPFRVLTPGAALVEIESSH